MYQQEKMKENKSETDFFLGLKLTMVTVPGDLFLINKWEYDSFFKKIDELIWKTSKQF